MISSEGSIRFAIRNVAQWGDTDVLPYPLENHWFHDDEESVVSLVAALDAEFDDWIASYPVIFDRILAGVGHMGFRGVTQVDPIWNIYLLSLVVEMGSEIEAARLPVTSKRVFSYRFLPDVAEGSLFDRSVGWGAFQTQALEEAKVHAFVTSTDISDFYPRVYHHRIENSLNKVTAKKAAAHRAKIILDKLAMGGVSYGLPIGGNSARLLAELLLNRTDRLLSQQGIAFCRFVDDYYLFAHSEEQARGNLVYLSEILLDHEGLSLQRSKTRLMTSDEFRRTSPLTVADEGEREVEARQFLKLRLMYDPYSPTAEEDYERLKEELRQFDIVGMLARELRKSRVDEALVRQLVKAIRHLDPDLRNAAVDSLVSNLAVLYPLFSTVALVIKGLLVDLSDEVKDKVFSALKTLLRAESHILMVPASLCFGIRLLAYDPAEETDGLLAQLYLRPRSSMLLKRDIILAMARRGVDHWIADTCRRSDTLTPWERRALIPASYLLGDEGKHWRDRVRAVLHRVDRDYMSWVGRKNDGHLWEIPF